MPDLHCPSCAAHLTENSFELSNKRASIKIDLDINCDLTVEDEVITVDSDAVGVELLITCWSCPWWGRLPLGVVNLDVEVSGFEALSDELQKAAGLVQSIELPPAPGYDYAPSYGGPVYPRREQSFAGI